MPIPPLPDQEPLNAEEAYRPENGESKVWLDMITEAEKAFEAYQKKADNIDKRYADLKRLADTNRDREYQLFWANCQVLAPSIYAKAPVPVVVPRFKDRRPLYTVSSEFLERATTTAFDIVDINSTMLLIRDDLIRIARGTAWVRYESKAESEGPTEKVCIEHVDRKDFLHEPSRNWSEVGWVARRAWMTLDELKDRFKPTSGDAYMDAVLNVMREANRKGAATREEKAAVWEMWSRTEGKVVWVTEGVNRTLDEGEPHLSLQGFFPCPRPAYSTVEPGSLTPVPDYLLYKDQLEEINQLTNRIHALSDAIKVKGFYPSGGEIGDKIEAALNTTDDRKIMIPVAGWTAFKDGAPPIAWLPIDMIAQVIQGLIEERKALIEDVYQIMGLSDIMRGSTEKDETATAQQIKMQSGSNRIRDKQHELARFAKDCVAIVAEIMAENFDRATLVDMAQMEIPTEADIAGKVKEIEQRAQQITAQLQAAQADPNVMAQAQANPERAQQMMQKAQAEIQKGGQEIAKLKEKPTIEKVMQFLRDNRIRPFVLDIETDSTIQPDEMAEKQQRGEFTDTLAKLLAQFWPAAEQYPQMIPFLGGVIKFKLAPFRAGRELEGQLDEAIEKMGAMASQQKPNPEAEKLKAQGQMEAQKMQLEQQKMQFESQARKQEIEAQAQIEFAKLQFEQQGKQQENEAKLAQINAQIQRDERKGQLEMQKLMVEIEASKQQLAIKAQSAQMDAQIRTESAQREAMQSERNFEQQSALAEQKAKQQQRPGVNG